MQVRSVKNFVLPCEISEGGRASTSLEVGARTLNQPENCMFKNNCTVYKGQMVKFKDHYFISRDPKSKLNDPNFFRIFERLAKNLRSPSTSKCYKLGGFFI